ncbi:MAG: TonB-dependent receptor [Gammaproteobacteria bacterium]|nr:TonB-dependent receptor [Gammaproteobacteria bacterium]
MSTKMHRRTLPCLASLLLLIVSNVATAQIEEIIVTATKRAENIQDVPISISAYSGEFLENSDIRTLQDLSLYAPNFTFATSTQPTNARIFIRGIGSVGNSGIETSVGVYVDGVYYPRPGSVIGNLLDIETAEVLRGPQGTLFGRNTAAGALNLTTRNPTDEVGGYVQAGFGDYSAYSLEGVFNTPLSEKVSARVAAKYSDRDGYGFNTLTDREIGERDDLTLRGKLGIDFTPNLYGKLTLDYNEIHTGGQIVELVPESASPVFDGTLTALFGSNATTANGTDQIINQDHQDSVDDEQWGASFDLEYSLGEHTLRSITAYRDWQADNRESALRLTGDVLPRNHFYTTQTFSQELQLLSPSDKPLTYVLGLFYYDEDYDIDEDFDAGADACVPLVFALAGAGAAALCQSMPQFPATDSAYQQKLTSTAAFAQATYNFTDRFSMTLGGRFTSDEKDASFIQTTPNAVIGSLFRAPESVPDLSSSDDAFTWLVNAQLHATDEVMLFASVSTGFKGGGFNSGGSGVALGRAARIFQEETSTNYELGIKSRFWDDKATANVTAYRTELDDFQDRSFDGISFLTRNAGKRTQTGFEADTVFNPTDSLMIFGAISYLNAEFDTFASASPLPGNTAPQDLSGRRPHFSPKWQGSLVAEWRAPVGSGNLEWFLRPEYTYIGDQNIGGNTNLNPQSIQDAYGLINLRLGLAAADGSWQVSAYGKNLSDEGYCEVMFDQPLGAAFGAVNAAANTVTQRCIVGAPRIYGVLFRMNFGS